MLLSCSLNPNSGFNLDFLNKEYKLASNIKDRQNRQCVEKVLNMLINKLKLYNSILSKGLVCVSGISNNGDEFVHVWEPFVTNHKQIYHCGSKYDIELFRPLFQISNDIGTIVMVSGDTTYIIHTDIPECSKFVIKHKIIGLLAKRQSRGGMSQNRIARLAEESRHQYTNRIITSINENTKGTKQVLMIGGGEIVQLVLERKDIQVKINCTDIKWNTTIDPIKFLVIEKSKIQIYFKKPSEKDELKIEQICSLLQKNPDWLSFGNEISEDTCEFILSIKQSDNKNDIIVPVSSPYYSKLKLFERIGKKFYIN